ncbi:hypothetical protein [Catellatospora vulcania]|uniref:hypothetical protein n=1 Tax=Catellatospora vulcania TaxID=1460450 RepID=UPI0012D3ED56|nr:hypothetical protein [Catellatospora vulcania]
MTSAGVRPVAALWLGGAVLAALSGCDPQPDPVATPTPTPASSAATTSPSASGPASPPPVDGIPKLDQAFMLQAVDRVEDPVLTVTASGRIGTYPGGADTGEREQFVLSPLSPGAKAYLLKTAKLRTGGEPLCVGVDGGVLHTVACDAADRGQAVTLVASTGMDGPRGADFDLIVGGRNVEVSADGKVSLRERIGPAQTAFRFVAAGPVGQFP